MRIVDLLAPSLVRVDAPWRSFDDTVAGLLGMVGPHHDLSAQQQADAVAGVLAREREASTALLEIAVGVPHARLPMLARPAVAVATSTAGLYEPVPTARIRVVALVLSPLAAIQSHLQILARLGALFRSDDLRSRLLRAPDADAAFAVLADFDRDPL